MIDFDLCWAYDFTDLLGNQYARNCYEYDRIQTASSGPNTTTATSRYWPHDVYDEYAGAAESKPATPRAGYGASAEPEDAG